MPAKSLFLLLCLCLSSFTWVVAQPVILEGTLSGVQVEGSTAYADLVKVIINARQGTPVSRIDLEAERDRVYSLGTFQEVTVSLEDRGAGPLLIITVKENPRIADITFEGVVSLPGTQLAELVKQQNLLEPGRVYNTTRAEEAITTIQQAYRSAGFPFDVPVTLSVEAAPKQTDAAEEPPLTVTYTISEEEALEEVRFDSSSVLDTATLEKLFRPLVEAKTFDPRAYQGAVQQVASLYQEKGFRQSGVDLGRSELQDGVLTVRFRELRIVSVDTTAIGVDASELSLGPGDLFNYDVLLEDVRRLSKGRSGDVRLLPRVTSSGEVRVAFELGAPESAGVITDLQITGNTVIPTEELLSLLGLKPGDTFSSTLATEDFIRIRSRYREAGYVIINQPDFRYRDGLYTQHIVEVKIAGYRVSYDGSPDNTQEFVITRYLPPVGSVYNINEVRNGLLEVARLGAVQPVAAPPEPGDNPDEVTIDVVVRKTQTGVFTPSAQYATDTGFSGVLTYRDSNFLGRAHNVGVEVTGQSSDVGLQFGGNVSYRIPWLYIDQFDFKEVPTSVSASIFSNVTTNNPLTVAGNTRVTFPGFPDEEGNQVLVGEYTQRDTGASFGIGRPLLDHTDIRFSVRGNASDFKLEPPATDCTFDGGKISNPQNCSLPTSESLRYLPQGGLSGFINTTVTFDDRDSQDFPRSGVAASGLLGVGLGTDFRDAATGEQRNYVFEQLEFGVKTYEQLKDLAPEEIQDPNHVLAFKVNIGHQFGNDYPSTKRFRVGKTSNEARFIRGFELGDFNLSRTYVTGSVEYRYDFGLATAATQTVIGIVFADVGWVSSVPGFSEYQTPIFAGAGLGVQINLGFGNVLLPALRFDYGFSERHPSGEFRFRIGPVF